MIVARSLVKALHDHWPLVESLVLKTRDTPFLDREVVSRTALVIHGQDRLAADDAVRQLLAKELLVAVGGRDEVQIHGPTRDYVLSLVQEHELGLAETILVEVEEMNRLGEEIQAALAREDLSAMQHPLAKLGNRMQGISSQLAHDHQAILNIADRARTFAPGTPLSERYREVLESYDRYIEPMTQLLQREQGGFAALTERIEDQVMAAERLGERRGALVTQRRRLGQIAYALRALRAQLRERMIECTETLLPLRQEALRNSAMVVAVATLVGIVRKKGLRHAIPEGRLRLGGATRSRRVVPGRHCKAYMADLIAHVPQAVSFPEAPEGPPSHQRRLRLEEVLERLRTDLPVPSLMPWLQGNLPDQDEKDHLRLYHELVRHFGDRATLQDQKTTERLALHAMTYHPHSLEAP